MIALNCHLPVSGKPSDQVFIKYEDKRIYPIGGQKYFEMHKASEHKFHDFHLEFPGRVDLDTVVLELWYRKNFFRNELAGRFFFMLNISEIGFSATQLIRSTSQDQSHYLIHWEMRLLKQIGTDVHENQRTRVKSL